MATTDEIDSGAGVVLNLLQNDPTILCPACNIPHHFFGVEPASVASMTRFGGRETLSFMVKCVDCGADEHVSIGRPWFPDTPAGNVSATLIRSEFDPTRRNRPPTGTLSLGRTSGLHRTSRVRAPHKREGFVGFEEMQVHTFTNAEGRVLMAAFSEGEE